MCLCLSESVKTKKLDHRVERAAAFLESYGYICTNGTARLRYQFYRDLFPTPSGAATNQDNVDRIATQMRPRSVRLFFSYSHTDEALRNALEVHLAYLKRQGHLKTWHDRMITPGEEWRGKIDEHLDNAEIILLLISPDFYHSDYCHDIEMKRAMARHSAGEARVIPIIVRPVALGDEEFLKLQCLPKDGKPVTSWDNQDAAWVNVVQGIQKQVEELTGS